MTTYSLVALTCRWRYCASRRRESQLPSSSSTDPVITGATFSVADSVKLPAKEPGVLVHLAVKEGTLVQAGPDRSARSTTASRKCKRRPPATP